jgi:acetyl esterase
MPIDRQVQQLLDQYSRFQVPPLHTLTPQQARQTPTLTDAARALLQQQGKELELEPVGTITDQTIPGPAGALPIRIYRPEGAGPFPVLVYFHGGGWVLGNLEFSDAACRGLANMARCLVVSVDYRLAPEHKFPAALDDAYAATQWVIQHAASIEGDPQRVAVGGESAGGNLATVVALRAHNRGDPQPIYQVLIYPVTNYAFDTPSYEQNANDPILSRDAMRWFWQHYLPSEVVGTHPYTSPLRAPNLSGLPSAIIITAEYDPLRDEGEAYAQRLRDAGVPAVASRYPGMTHMFFKLPGLLESARKALVEVSAGLRSAFSREPAARQRSLPQNMQLAADESAAPAIGAAASDRAQVMPADGPQQQNPPIIPSDAETSEGAAAMPASAQPNESAPVIPADTPSRAHAPIIPSDEGLAAGDSIIPADGPPAQASAPVIPSDTQVQPVARAGTTAPVRVGQRVVDAAGAPLGTVKALSANDFVIAREGLPDLTLPLSAIHATGEQVMLALPASEAETLPQFQPPTP